MKAHTKSRQELLDSHDQEIIRRVTKIFCEAMRQHRVSPQRIADIVQQTMADSVELSKDPYKWAHIDEHLHSMGFEFEDEDILEREESARDIRRRLRL